VREHRHAARRHRESRSTDRSVDATNRARCTQPDTDHEPTRAATAARQQDSASDLRALQIVRANHPPSVAREVTAERGNLEDSDLSVARRGFSLFADVFVDHTPLPQPSNACNTEHNAADLSNVPR
jgi:hypothetical protein